MLTWTLENTLFFAMECIIVDKTRMLRCILGVFASLEGAPLGAWIAECMNFYALLEPCLTECMRFYMYSEFASKTLYICSLWEALCPFG